MESVLTTIIATQNPKTKNAPIRVRFFMFGFVSIFVESAVVVKVADGVVIVVIDFVVGVYVSDLIVA